MQRLHAFEVTKSCQACKLRVNGFYCKLPPGVFRAFDTVQSTSVYAKGAVLFVEKEEPRGIFMLCDGQVKLSVSSSDGKTLILRVAKAGEVLGLASVLAGTGYEATAETCCFCQVAFVRRDDFLAVRCAPTGSLSGYREAIEQVLRRGLRATANGWVFGVRTRAAW
jgi:CRP/FNR family transcriptional regulator, cyclic AMP receptor protein